jgi:FKBP-type peptidyl-prolyl cis-trans isomerase
MLAGVAAAALVAACKREGSATGPGSSAPAIARAPRMAGPTPDDMAKEKRAALLAKLNVFAPLEGGTVQITPDGESWTRYPNLLMIHDLRPSSEGLPPKLGQTVTLTYIGTIPGSGKVFDKHDAANPFSFTMGSKDFIQGFSLGLSTMHVGGKRRIFVPPDLGYGAGGNPMADIPGNQALIFEVELLSISGEAVEITADDLPKVEAAGPPAPASTTAPAGTSPASRP